MRKRTSGFNSNALPANSPRLKPARRPQRTWEPPSRGESAGPASRPDSADAEFAGLSRLPRSSTDNVSTTRKLDWSAKKWPFLAPVRDMCRTQGRIGFVTDGTVSVMLSPRCGGVIGSQPSPSALRKTTFSASRDRLILIRNLRIPFCPTSSTSPIRTEKLLFRGDFIPIIAVTRRDDLVLRLRIWDFLWDFVLGVSDLAPKLMRFEA